MSHRLLLGPAALLLVSSIAGCGASAPAPESANAAEASPAAGAQPGYGYAPGMAQMGAYPQAAPPSGPSEPMEEKMADAGGAPPPAPPPPVMPAAAPKKESAAGPAAAVRPSASSRPSGAPSRPAPKPTDKRVAEDEDGAAQAQARGIRAGEWDDNGNYRDFLGYIGQKNDLGIERIDVTSRRFLVVRDVAGKGVPGCLVRVRDEAQHEAQLTTTASGRAILFPRAMGLSGGALMARTECQGQAVQARFDTAKQDDVVVMQLPKARASVGAPVVDVAFVLDTTGSMSEEIREVKETLRRVSDTLSARGVKVRIGLVEYKDKGDDFVTKTYPMTSDISAFSRTISHIQASGGGDMPENANEGLEVALRDLTWSSQSVARLAFVIADAPPHLEYQDAQAYSVSAKDASKRGIQIFTVATSGMNDLGQAVFRQIAQFTGGTNMFVLRGGAGPQSTGAGDAESSCGGTHQNFQSGNLDQLITHTIAQEIAAVNADPMRIAGLGQDERAKPCKDRVLVLAD